MLLSRQLAPVKDGEQYMPTILHYMHFAAGTLVLAAGAGAALARKGGQIHRRSGHIFVVAMSVLASSGAILAALRPERLSVISGLLTLYLIFTGTLTLRRRAGAAGLAEVLALLFVLSCAAADVVFGMLALAEEHGALDGYPAMAYFIFASIALLAAGFDASVIRRGGISGADRLRRHLWRMCLAFFIATSSFFIGQQKVMPLLLQGSPLLIILAFSPLLLMLAWMFRLRRRTSADRVPSQFAGVAS
jgi:uncharacterized membrane protein